MVEEPGDAFLNGADPDFIFTGRQRIASLREGSEDGGEAERSPERGHRAALFFLQRPVRLSRGLQRAWEPENAELDSARGIPDFAGSGPGVIAGICHGERRVPMVPRTRFGIVRGEESELGAVPAGGRGSVE